jgi:hypothetical protein
MEDTFEKIMLAIFGFNKFNNLMTCQPRVLPLGSLKGHTFFLLFPVKACWLQQPYMKLNWTSWDGH